jgi:hypothetical protein
VASSGPEEEEKIWATLTPDAFIKGVEFQTVSDLRLALGVSVPAALLDQNVCVFVCVCAFRFPVNSKSNKR